MLKCQRAGPGVSRGRKYRSETSKIDGMFQAPLCAVPADSRQLGVQSLLEAELGPTGTPKGAAQCGLQSSAHLILTRVKHDILNSNKHGNCSCRSP